MFFFKKKGNVWLSIKISIRDILKVFMEIGKERNWCLGWEFEIWNRYK